MNRFGLSIVLAVLAGLIGAAVWAGVAYGANVEIGWVAWGIGVIVGLAMAMGGARGQTAGVVAAAITVGAICAGKVAAVRMSVNSFVDKELAAALTPEMYEEHMEHARLFADVKSREEYLKYMVERGYSEAEEAEAVTAEEVTEFEENVLPALQEVLRNSPDYEQWKAAQLAAAREAFTANVTFVEMLKETLGPIDIIFFLLGVVTAYKIPASAEAVGRVTE